tara:strand:+ start:1231 stop:1449 length:219 start_codon:yes stop_codon:yes gene_type:complete
MNKKDIFYEQESLVIQLTEMLGLDEIKGKKLYQSIIDEVNRLNLIERWTTQEMDCVNSTMLDVFLKKFGYER